MHESKLADSANSYVPCNCRDHKSKGADRRTQEKLTEIHDVITADCTVVHHNIPCPQGNLGQSNENEQDRTEGTGRHGCASVGATKQAGATCSFLLCYDHALASSASWHTRYITAHLSLLAARKRAPAEAERGASPRGAPDWRTQGAHTTVYLECCIHVGAACMVSWPQPRFLRSALPAQ